MATPMVNKDEHYRRLGEFARMRADQRLMDRFQNLESANEYFYHEVKRLREHVAQLEKYTGIDREAFEREMRKELERQRQ